MNNWVYIISAISLVLLVYLLWKELTRANRSRLGLRATSTIVAVVALYCMGMPFTWQRKDTVTDPHTAILLTEGFQKDSLAVFGKTTGTKIPVLTWDENIFAAQKDVRLLTASDSMINQYSTLHVFGYGLNEKQAEHLQQAKIIFHPTPLPTGLTSIHWATKLETGKRWLIQGKFHNAQTSVTKIVLADQQGALDSLSIAAGRDELFQFSTVPKQLGRAVFSLYVINNKDTIEKEPIAVETTPAIPVKVLLLSSSPDFENKFLQTWLSEKGYEVVARTTISKNKLGKEFLNTAAVSIDNINYTLLEQFAVVVADAAALSSLSSNELQTIRSAVSEQGKGLIIKTDSAAGRNSFYASLFPVMTAAPGSQKYLTIRLSSNPKDTLHTLPIEQPCFIRQQPGTQTLVTDKNNHVLVNSALYGSGKLLVSTLPNTFSWMLSGNQTDYDALWSELLTAAAPRITGEENWSAPITLAHENEPMPLFVENASQHTQAVINGATIPLITDSLLPALSTGVYWPLNTGWISGIKTNGQLYYQYIYNTGNWKNIQWADNMQRTKKMTAHKNQSGTTIVQTGTITVAFPKIIFFLGFLFACAYLWFENKYYYS